MKIRKRWYDKSRKNEMETDTMEERRERRTKLEKWLGIVLTGLFALFLFWEAGTLGSEAESRVYRVYCMGDSITYGSGLAGEERDIYSYPAQLQQMLGEHYEVTNYGVRGRTLLDIPDRDYRSTGYIDAVKQQSPDILIIMLGTNDSRPGNWDAAAYKQQYLALVEELQRISSKPDIYLMAPPQAYPGEEGAIIYGINNDVIRDEIRQIVSEVSGETGAELIDLYAVTENHPEYFKDGVHPNREGYTVLAETICDRIQKDR